MKTDLLWLIIYGLFAMFGVRRPYLALCGLVWIDTLKPQDISFGILSGASISYYASIFLIFSIVLNLKKINIPQKIAPIFLVIVFMGWITLTSYYAEFQDAAWFKYNIAIKTILITLFIPFLIDTRLKMESLVVTIVIAVSYYTIVGGGRTLLGQIQYGVPLVETNAPISGMTETSTLSMVAIMVIPLISYLYKKSIIISQANYLKPFLAGLIFASILTAIGTYARTGLIALIIYALIIVFNTKNKVRILSSIIIAIMIIAVAAPQSWKDRMHTITKPQNEGSALGRLVVWAWTIDYAKTHPLIGGGFNSYLANAGKLNEYTDESADDEYTFGAAKAFHNIFFEVLGEHGYVGLGIFVTILFLSFKMNRQIIRSKKHDDWSYSMAKSFNHSLIIFCICGNFVGVAFTQWPYYFISMAVCLHNSVMNET